MDDYDEDFDDYEPEGEDRWDDQWEKEDQEFYDQERSILGR